MTKDKVIKERPRIIKYQGDGYHIKISSDWHIHKVGTHQTFFYGPKVGKARVGFYITVLPKRGKTYLDAANKMKATQGLEKNYTILGEKDISEENFIAFMRKSSLYNPEIDMTVFVRDIFTESGTKVFILSSSIPNSAKIAEIDSVIVAMMNSFQFEGSLQDTIGIPTV